MAKVSVNKTQAKELLDFCTNNMLMFFERRAEFVLSNNTLAVREFLAKLPYYLHFNQPKLPFYIPNAPAGIQDFSPDLAFMQKHRFGNNTLPEEELLLKGIYLMGSITSVTFTKDSDLDIWVVVDRKLSQEQRSLLADKLAQINIFFSNYELSFYIVDEDHILYDRQTNQIITDLGVKDKYFLLDEFYRSVAYLAGKPLLWFALPDIPGYSYQEVKQLYLDYELIKAEDWIDFGGFDEELSRRSFYATILWLLYKGLNNPFKSYLKILLLEYYISLYPQVEFLAQTLKRAIHANGMEQVDLQTHLELFTLQQSQVNPTPIKLTDDTATTELDSLVAEPDADSLSNLTKEQQLEAVEQQLKQELFVEQQQQTLARKEQFKQRATKILNKFSWEEGKISAAEAEYVADNESSRLRARLYEESLGSFSLNQEGQELIEQGISYLLKVSQQQQLNFEQFIARDKLYAQVLACPNLVNYLTTSYFDSYELVLAAVMLYLEQQQDAKRKGLVASSLLLKLNSRLASTLAQLTQACDGNSWKAVDYFLQYFKQGCLPQLSSSLIALLNNLSSSFGVSLASQKAALHFNYWKIGELVNYSQLYQASLIKTYIKLTEFVFADLTASDHLQISFLSSSELEAIEESIFSLFIRHRNQVTVYKLLPDLDLAEEALYFGSFRDEEDNLVWYVITFDITDPLSKVEHKHVEVKYDLITLVTWCYLNGLITDKTKLFIKPAAGFDRHYLEQVVNGLKQQFGKSESYFKRISQRLSDYLGDTSVLLSQEPKITPKTKRIHRLYRKSAADLELATASTTPNPGVGLVRSFITPISGGLWPEYLRPNPSFAIEQNKLVPLSWLVNSSEESLVRFAQNRSQLDEEVTNSPYLVGIASSAENSRQLLQAELAALITRIAIVFQQQGLAPDLTEKLIHGRGQKSCQQLEQLLTQYATDLEQTKVGYLISPYADLRQDQEALGEWLGYFSNAAIQRQIPELDCLVVFQRWEANLLAWQFTAPVRAEYQARELSRVELVYALPKSKLNSPQATSAWQYQPRFVSLELTNSLAILKTLSSKVIYLDYFRNDLSHCRLEPHSWTEGKLRSVADKQQDYQLEALTLAPVKTLLPENLLLVYRPSNDKNQDSLVLPYQQSLTQYLAPSLAEWEREAYVLSFVINCNSQGWLQIERKAIAHKDDLALLLTAFSQYGEVNLVTRFYRQLERFIYSRALIFNYQLLPEELEQFQQAMRLIPNPKALSLEGIFSSREDSSKHKLNQELALSAEHQQLGVPESSLLTTEFIATGEIGQDLHTQVFPNNADSQNLKSLSLDLQQLRQQRQATSLLEILKARFGKSSSQLLTMQQLIANSAKSNKVKLTNPPALLHQRKYLSKHYLHRYSLADLQAIYELGQLALQLHLESLSDSVAKLQQLTTRLTKFVSLSFTQDLNLLAEKISRFTETELASLVEPEVPYAKIDLDGESQTSVAQLRSLNQLVTDLRQQHWQGKQVAYPLLQSVQKLDVAQLYRELNLNINKVANQQFNFSQLTQINLDPVLELLVTNLPHLQASKLSSDVAPITLVSFRELGLASYVHNSAALRELQTDATVITQTSWLNHWRGSWRFTPNYPTLDTDLPAANKYGNLFKQVIADPSRAAIYFATWIAICQPKLVLFDLIRNSLRMHRIIIKAQQALLQLSNPESKVKISKLPLSPAVRYIYGLRHYLSYQIPSSTGFQAAGISGLAALSLRDYVAELCFTQQEQAKAPIAVVAEANLATMTNSSEVKQDFLSSLEQVSQEEATAPTPTENSRARFNRYSYYASPWLDNHKERTISAGLVATETPVLEPRVVEIQQTPVANARDSEAPTISEASQEVAQLLTQAENKAQEDRLAPRASLARTLVAESISRVNAHLVRQTNNTLPPEYSISRILAQLQEKFTLAFQGKITDIEESEEAQISEQLTLFESEEFSESALANSPAVAISSSALTSSQESLNSEQPWSYERQFFDTLRTELVVLADLLEQELKRRSRETDVYHLFSHNWYAQSVTDLQRISLRFNPLLGNHEYSLGQVVSDTVRQVVDSFATTETPEVYYSPFADIDQQVAISKEQAKLNLGVTSFNPDLSRLTYNLCWLLRHDGLLRVLIANEQLQLSQLEVVKLAQLQSQLSLYKRQLQKVYQDKLEQAQQRAYYLPTNLSLVEQAQQLQKARSLTRTEISQEDSVGETEVNSSSIANLATTKVEEDRESDLSNKQKSAAASFAPNYSQNYSQGFGLSFLFQNSHYRKVMADLFRNRVLVLNSAPEAETTQALAAQESLSQFKKFSLGQLSDKRVIFDFATSWCGHWNLDLVSRLLNTSVHARDSELDDRSFTATASSADKDFILTKKAGKGLFEQIEISVDSRAKLERYLILNRGKEFELMRPLVIDSNNSVINSVKVDQKSSLGKELQQLAQRQHRLGQLDTQIYLSDSLARQAILHYEQDVVPTAELLRNYQRNLTREFKVAVGRQLTNYLRLITDRIKVDNYRQQVLGQTQDTHLLLSDLLSLSYLRDSEELTSGMVFIYYNHQLNDEQLRALLWLQENSQLDILNFRDQLVEHCYLVYTTKVGTWRNVKFVGKQALNNLLSYIQFRVDSKQSFTNLKVNSLNFKTAEAINEAVANWLEASLSQQHITAKKAQSYEQAYLNYRSEFIISSRCTRIYSGHFTYEHCVELKANKLGVTSEQPVVVEESELKELKTAVDQQPLSCLQETSRSLELRKQGLAQLCWTEFKRFAAKLLLSSAPPVPLRRTIITKHFRLRLLEAESQPHSFVASSNLALPSLHLLAPWQLEQLIGELHQLYNQDGVFQIWVEDIGGFAQEKYNFLVFAEDGEVFLILEANNSLAKHLASALVASKVDLHNRLRKAQVTMLTMHNLSSNPQANSTKTRNSFTINYRLPLQRQAAGEADCCQLELVFTPMRDWSRRLSESE